MGVINERRRMKPSYFFLFFKFPQILLYLLSTHFHLTFGLINLQFNKTKSSFKIAIFADLHFGENSWTDWGPQQDANSINAMNSLLHHENPGDGNCSFMGTTRLELMNYQIGNDMLSFSQHGSRNLWPSVSNYVLQISSSENPESPVAFMYFLDSGGGSYPEVISSAQVEWLKGISEAINPDYRVPEIFFWHIPSKAYQKAAPWLFFVPQPCVGSINKEWVCTQESEEGIMKILKGRPSVQAVFVGHDHGNDWCCPYKKLWLCYARHTGYGGYGNWARGARILEIVDRPFTLKSWIRMEDGFVHSHILLSSHAAYPAPIFLLLVLLLVLFFGIKPFYRADLISKAKTFVSPIA
ncbi:probable inactive purple acid phosphatase 16 isoform X2 [Chenopodium quinoa]|uniref:probable inactive purple acid phosphatase 16 isoform X2 n=1 Tax=Chenopodium quinoa TaxID=63459 RepID=UPI000B778978|nr:probable inactive purple acid phosphatase 16 isoform X2 [Chenopodium quinoa]